VQVRWGNALQILPELKLPEGCTGIDLLLLDGVPKESLAYLRAAEPLLADGAVIVADNAGEAPLVLTWTSQ
jgi:predicted O-methyltransferase YrrM